MRAILLFAVVALVVGCLVGCPKEEEEIGPTPMPVRPKTTPPEVKAPEVELVKCVVCGEEMAADEMEEVEYEGNTYHVCLDECKAQWDEDPATYAEAAALEEEEEVTEPEEGEGEELAPLEEEEEPVAEEEPVEEETEKSPEL